MLSVLVGININNRMCQGAMYDRRIRCMRVRRSMLKCSEHTSQSCAYVLRQGMEGSVGYQTPSLGNHCGEVAALGITVRRTKIRPRYFVKATISLFYPPTLTEQTSDRPTARLRCISSASTASYPGQVAVCHHLAGGGQLSA